MRGRLWVLAKGYAPDEGGMQTYARQVAETYAASGWQVTVFTQSSAGPRDVAVGGTRIVDIGAGRGVRVPWRLLRAMRRTLAAEGAPDAVHATTWRTAVLPMLLGLPYVATVHGREIMYARGPVRRLMRRVLGGAERVVAVSAHTRARLIERVPMAAERSVVAWNGVSAGIRPGPAAGGQPPLVLSLCRIEPRKNLSAAVAAAAACAARGHGFRYVICGRGPELAALRAQVAALGLDDRVVLRGFVPAAEAAALYAEAEIFLHPQIAIDDGRDFEGFGIAVADAMAARTACVVGRAGGTGELISDGVDGLVVDGAAPDSVTAALDRLLADPAGRRRMAEAAARHAVERFDWHRHCRIALGLVQP